MIDRGEPQRGHGERFPMRRSQRLVLADLIDRTSARRLARLIGISEAELGPVSAGEVAPTLSDRAKILTYLQSNALIGHCIDPRDHDVHGPGRGPNPEGFEQLGDSKDQRRFERCTADGGRQ